MSVPKISASRHERWPDIRQSRWIWPCICAVVLLVLRILLLALNTDLSNSFSHDSAYIGIVVRNLLHGKGWVNDASWLVFLNPDRLPMPYRSANPLYPLLTALAVKVLGISIVHAGLLVSALANAGLLLAAFYLVSYWLKDTRKALLIALAATVFPSIWQDSLRMLPDALHLTLLMAGAAFFVRGEKLSLCIIAGIFFGLAWLTRSTASLMAPALAVYAFAAWGRRKAAFSLLLAGAAALVTASPWLIRTARVWGSPFSNDTSSFALFQDIYARKYGGSVDRYWRSPEPPPSPLQLVRTDGVTVLTATLTGIPKVFKAWLRAGWEEHYLPRMVFVVLLGSAAIACRGFFPIAPLLASAAYAALQLAVMGVRGDSVEPRYLAPLTALAVLWLGCGIAALAAKRRASGVFRFVIIPCGLLLALYVPFQDAALARTFAAEDRADAHRRRVRRSISANITHLDPVIVVDPYFYSYDTGAQALSIPSSSDAYLLRYMEKYHAHWIILTADEVRFWKPGWLSQLPPWVRIRGVFDGNTLFERAGSR